jgi:MFS family permease
VARSLVSRVTQSSFVADLRTVLGEPGFRRLFATRLISQSGDGLYTAGFGAYVFFSATSYPNPGSAALAFAVLYLPYSLIGPFAGVFIDRWSRRQILVLSAIVRAALVAVSALLITFGSLGLPLYISALAVLGVNRFFLSSLSAALPHVVPEDELVMANSVAPTIGGIATTVAGTAGAGVRLLVGGGHGSAAAIVLAAGVCYLLAGLTAATTPRDGLGPTRGPGTPPPAALSHALADVARGLAAGVGYLRRRRSPAAALGAIGAYRVLYGIAFLMSILLYRNYFYQGGGGSAALGHFLIVVIATAIGYGLAAVVSPPVTRRISKETWITALLGASAVAAGALGVTFSQVPFLALGFILGLTGQGIAISATTILQERVDDDFRGRAFSLYDMMFNAVYVLGAVVGALVTPVDGKSYPLIVVMAVGYLLAAAAYGLLSRQVARYGRPAPESPSAPPLGSAEGTGDGGTESPSPSAQSSSS